MSTVEKIIVCKRPDGQFQATTKNDLHGAGSTIGAALRELGEYIDALNEAEKSRKGWLEGGPGVLGI